MGAIRYEHKVLYHMESRGWPVAVPATSRDGTTVIDVNDRRYALFPFLGGRPRLSDDTRSLRFKGGLLARLHRDLASWPAPGQREGFGQIWDLHVHAPRPDYETFNDVLQAFAREEPESAALIRAYRRTNLDDLTMHGYGSLPMTTVHTDFHRDNIFFRRGQLTAVLDFDLVHLDARATDVATSIAQDCQAHMSIEPEAAQAFVSGYVEESPLVEAELRLVVPLIRAYFLWLCAFGLARWADGNDKATLGISRTVTQRLPNLDAGAGGIEKAVMTAGEAVL